MFSSRLVFRGRGEDSRGEKETEFLVLFSSSVIFLPLSCLCSRKHQGNPIRSRSSGLTPCKPPKQTKRSEKGSKRGKTHHFRLLGEEHEDLICGVVLFGNENRQVVPAGDVAVRVAERVEGGVEVVLIVFFLRQRRSTKVRERRKSGRRRPGIFRRQTLSLLLLPRFSSSPFFSLCILLLTSATKYPRSLSIWKHVLRTRKAREAGSIFESADDAGLNEEREALLSAVLARSFSRS